MHNDLLSLAHELFATWITERAARRELPESANQFFVDFFTSLGNMITVVVEYIADTGRFLEPFDPYTRSLVDHIWLSDVIPMATAALVLGVVGEVAKKRQKLEPRSR